MDSHLKLTCGFFMLLPAVVLADEKPAELILATWNLEWFFDNYQGDNASDLAKKMSAPNRSEWDWKCNGVAAAIAEIQPTIIALQEVESRRVAWYLTRRLQQAHGLKYRIAFVEGTDTFTEQDVAILFQSGLVSFGRREQSSEMFNSKQYYNLSKHLITRFEWGKGEEKESLLLLNVHLRARAEIAPLRQRQCRLIRHWTREAIVQGENVVVLGDINTETTFSATPPDTDMGILRGLATPKLTDNLFDLHKYLPAKERASHLLPGKQFDRILVSQPLLENQDGKRDLVFQSMQRRKDLCVRGKQADEDHWNIYYQIPQAERDLSDHYPLVARFQFD